MKNYVLCYEETETCIAKLDVRALDKKNTSGEPIFDSEKQKLALQLIKSWIRDITEGDVTAKDISFTNLKEGIKQGKYSIQLYGLYLRAFKTNYVISIKENKNEEL